MILAGQSHLGGVVATWFANFGNGEEKQINLHLTDVILTSFINEKIVSGPNRMSFEAMTELVKPVVGSDMDFDRLVEQLLNEGSASLKAKDRPNSKITVSMVHSS